MALQVTVEKITPNRAEGYLNQNNFNRRLREGLAEKYSRDMKIGKWTDCTAPIVFYSDGDIADGQHRLWAIIDSGVTMAFIVVRGLPREAGLNIDTGAVRTLVDNARISGQDPDLNNTLIAVAKGIELGNRVSADKAQMSNAQKIALVQKHRKASEWAVAHGPQGRYLRNAMILSALGRACYHESNLEKLARFSEVLKTGFADGPKESAAIAMRNYLQMKGGQGIMLTGALWNETFLKAQNAIQYFMKGKALTTIRVVKEEAYPLPGEKELRMRKPKGESGGD